MWQIFQAVLCVGEDGAGHDGFPSERAILCGEENSLTKGENTRGGSKGILSQCLSFGNCEEK